MKPQLQRTARYAVGLVLALLLDVTRCSVPPIASEIAKIPPALIITEGKTNQGFPYLFGGVSSDERQAMQQRAKDYNLKLVFAERNGPYLSDVDIGLRSAKGDEILAIATDGPWFYIQLPPGTYEVKATFKGETKQIKNLRVTRDKTVQQTFVWNLGEEAK